MHILRNFTLPNFQDKDTKVVIQDKKPMPQIALPEDSKPMIEELKITPQASQEITAPIEPTKPKADLTDFDALEKNQPGSLAALEKQLGGAAGLSLDKVGAHSLHQPIIQVPGGKGDGGSASAGGIPGRQSLDAALGSAGGPISNKPIAMRGGALFEWGKAELLPNAIADLQKLGMLIKRNPNATFIISGHTDHTGTRDANLILSQQRADAVRDWLVTNLMIDPTRITSIGKADDEAFPDLGPEKSIEEQAPNRRVEIVIKTHRK
jgi:outer membrane protein OmpA-like peptidoglycan-associated protein